MLLCLFYIYNGCTGVCVCCMMYAYIKVETGDSQSDESFISLLGHEWYFRE